MKRISIPPGMQLATIWVVWSFLSLGVLGLGLHVILASVGRLDDMAAWIQAVGSVGAIIAAVWVSSAQGQQQIELIRNQEAESLKKVVAVAKYVGKINQTAYGLLLPRPDSGHSLAMITEGQESSRVLLNEVPYHMVPGSEASIGWIELRFATAGMQKIVERYLEAWQLSDVDWEQLERLVQFSDEAVHRIVSASQGHVPQLNTPDEANAQ